MARPRKSEYRAGDQLHFIITDDFVDTANAFFRHCDEHMLNPSAVVRKAMTLWLDTATGQGGGGEADNMPGAPHENAIEDVFVIYKDGALLAHASRRLIPNFDLDIFSSMLTLIQGFVTESFRDIQDAGIRMIEFGGQKILIEPGRSVDVMLAVVWSGDIEREDVENIAHSILYDIEFTYGRKLKDWDGNLNKLRGMREMIIRSLS